MIRHKLSIVLIIVFLALATVFMGCGTTAEFTSLTQDEQENLIDITQPARKSYREVTVFVTTVEKRSIPNGPVLLVKGQLPNGCARLLKASYTYESKKTDKKTIELQMVAWKYRGEMCTQQMVPFTYLIEELSAKKIKKLEQYRYQDETHPLN